jgi:PiT family inorganic phosphate transporter
VVGFGILVGGPSAIQWAKIGTIVASWLISPLVGGIIAFVVFRYISRAILEDHDPVRAVKRRAPAFVFFVLFLLVLSFIYKGLKVVTFPASQAFGLATAVGGAAAVVAFILARRIRPDRATRRRGQLLVVESVFRPLQVMTACFVAFAHGSNDVANAVGPLAAVLSVHQTGQVEMSVPVPIWVLGLGGVGIVLGLLTYGYKVIETIGRKITELTPSRGFTAGFAAATTILVGSKLGLPLSTTHVLVGSVMGVGFARGMGALNIRIVRNILASWVITLPFTALVTMLLYPLIRALL